MIEIRDLKFDFGDSSFRLAIPVLEIEAGSRVALVGPSGSGKTTLLNLVSGILVAERGHLLVAGVEVGRLSDAARRDFRITSVGMVFQDFELIDYLNVRENILLPYRINRRLNLAAGIRQSAERLAESMEIGDKLSRPVERLSQGERQRVAICRALLTGPRLILADEPTGHLDPANKDHIMQILLDRSRETAATLLVVTHDHGLLGNFDRVIDFADFHAVRRPGDA